MTNEEILAKLNEIVEANNKLAVLINALKESATPVAAPPAPPAAETGAPAKLVMTEKANGMTYEQYIEAGWTDQQLIDNGMATAPVAAPPAPPAAETGVPAPPAPPAAETGAPAPPAPPAAEISAPASPVNTMTPEQLNDILVAEFNRLGDRALIDAELKKLDVNGVTELPAEKYQELVDNVKALKKAV